MAAKLLSLLRPEMPVGAWRAVIDGLLADGVPGLQRQVFNKVLPLDVRTGAEVQPVFVAIVESWLENRAQADALAERLRAAGEMVQLFADAVLIHDSGLRPLPSKIMVTLRGLCGLTRQQAQVHWRTRHVEVGLIEHGADAFLRLYYQNHVSDTDQPPGSAWDLDGMPEYWVDPADLASVGQDSPVMQAIAEDEKLFADTSSIITMMVTEDECFVAAGAQSGWPVQESPLRSLFPKA